MVNGTVLLTLPRSIASGSAPPFQQDWAPCANGRGQHGQRPSTRRAFIIRPKSLCSCSMRCSMRAFMGIVQSEVRSGRQGVRAGSLGESKEGHGLGMAWGGLARYHKDSQSTICVNMLYSVCVYVYIYIYMCVCVCLAQSRR